MTSCAGPGHPARPAFRRQHQQQSSSSSSDTSSSSSARRHCCRRPATVADPAAMSRAHLRCQKCANAAQQADFQHRYRTVHERLQERLHASV